MSEGTTPHYHQNHPFLAQLLENRLLNGPGSAKDTRHLVVDLAGSGLRYECGDSLGLYPTNRPEDVTAILTALQATGEEPVTLGKDPAPVPFREALWERLYFLANPTRKLLQALHARAADPQERSRLETLLDPAAAAATESYLGERHFSDVLLDFPSARLAPQEFAGLCRRLTPRLYSIASSPTLFPEQVHLTVAAVRYHTLGRDRVGVGSTYGIDRVPLGQRVLPVFIASSHFRPPADETDLIMIGPGTGVAPFRAFLQERRARGARGRNWLFFGGQRSATDFLYGEEFTAWQREGHLTRLDLAWSRDQGHKVYVQDRLRENAVEVWRWLEAGASLHVCGDKERMARDVEAALLEIIGHQGGFDPAGAAACLARLKKEKRYQRDVY